MASGAAPRLSINEASLNAWVANGAQMSDTVARLYKEFKKAAAPAA
jgi:small subunit ribosomal protein S16